MNLLKNLNNFKTKKSLSFFIIILTSLATISTTSANAFSISSIFSLFSNSQNTKKLGKTIASKTLVKKSNYNNKSFFSAPKIFITGLFGLTIFAGLFFRKDIYNFLSTLGKSNKPDNAPNNVPNNDTPNSLPSDSSKTPNNKPSIETNLPNKTENNLLNNQTQNNLPGQTQNSNSTNTNNLQNNNSQNNLTSSTNKKSTKNKRTCIIFNSDGEFYNNIIISELEKHSDMKNKLKDFEIIKLTPEEYKNYDNIDNIDLLIIARFTGSNRVNFINKEMVKALSSKANKTIVISPQVGEETTMSPSKKEDFDNVIPDPTTLISLLFKDSALTKNSNHNKEALKAFNAEL